MRRAITVAIATTAVLGMFVAGAFLFSPSAVVAQEDAESGATESTSDTVRVMPESIEDILADLVVDNVITQEQADAVAEAIGERARFRGHGFRGGPGGFGFGLDLQEALGVTPQELMEALQAGETIADIAAANGVDLDSLIDEALAEIESHLEGAVENGRLDATDVDEKLADIEEHITDLVNGELPDGFGERDRLRGGAGFRGFGPESGPAEGTESAA